MNSLLLRLSHAGIEIRPRTGPTSRPEVAVEEVGAVAAIELPHIEEALTHPSFANEQRGGQRVDNQRLEFLGDAVLGLVACELLMEQFPDADEGALSLMRSRLVNSEALAAWARAIELGSALSLGRGADIAGERETVNVLADAVEALVGAIHLDCEPATTRNLVAHIVSEPLARLASEGFAAARDAKSELQQQVQAAGGPSPRYRVVETEGPDHRRVFVVVVEVDGAVVGEGRGRSKKLAEQAAARAALEPREEVSAEPAPMPLVCAVRASEPPGPGVSQ